MSAINHISLSIKKMKKKKQKKILHCSLGIVFSSKLLKMLYRISVSSQIFLHKNVTTAVLG